MSLKRDKSKSTWDDDIDPQKVEKLSPQEKHKYFPDEYSSDGKPYGDF